MSVIAPEERVLKKSWRNAQEFHGFRVVDGLVAQQNLFLTFTLRHCLISLMAVKNAPATITVTSI